MINSATADSVRLLVKDIHTRGQIVRIYEVARKVPPFIGGHDLKELTDFIAQEAVRIRANVSWDEADTHKSNGHDLPLHRGDGTQLVTPGWEFGVPFQER